MDREERIEAMVGWFFENFEDPAQHTPYESREGGYQYIWGGPYDALEEIGEAFPDAEQEQIEEAVDEAQADGTFDWAPNGRRIQLEDYEDLDLLDEDLELDGGPQEPLENRLLALAGQLDRIEKHVAALQALQETDGNAVAGIGHNRPPQPLDDEPNLSAIDESIADVRGELAKPGPREDVNAEKLVRAETRFRRFLAWIREQAANAPKNLATGAVGAIGAAAMKYVFEHYDEILAALQPAISTISDWAVVVGSMF